MRAYKVTRPNDPRPYYCADLKAAVYAARMSLIACGCKPVDELEWRTFREEIATTGQVGERFDLIQNIKNDGTKLEGHNSATIEIIEIH